MLKHITQLFTLLTKQQRKNFYLLQILVVFTAIMEIVSIASIIPFMTLVGDMSLVQQNATLIEIYHYSGVTSELQFVFVVGFAVLIIFCISSIISMFT